MPEWKWIVVVIILSLLITGMSSAAEIADTITLGSSKEWVVANDVDTATLTAIVKNSTSGNGIAGVPVVFTVNDPKYGRIASTSGNSDTNGMVTATFAAFNTSGTATLRATAAGLVKDLSQKIDHDIPARVTFEYNPEVLVGGTTPITGTFTDKWGNLVDNRRTAEAVYLAIGSPEGGGYFYFFDGHAYVQEITLYTNATGQVGTICQVDTKGGDNIIYMQHLGSIPDKYFTIIGISEGVPYSMTAAIYPKSYPNPYVHADGTSKFSLVYTLYDAYGNTAGNRTFWVNTSIGESYLLRSNSLGQILATYGPKEIVCTIKITATAVDNTSVTSSQDVEFVSAAPTNMVVTANPETMGSWDVPGAKPATVYAKVMDSKGNPVKGETVSFSIDSYAADAAMTRIPSFSSSAITTTATAETGEDGKASVSFYPGAFPTSGAGYDSTATGTATVSAHWGASVMPIVLTFKNYPYLRVETSVDPPTIEGGKWFDVDLKLIGDGWKLQAHPIDAVLVIDVSGSMDDTDYTIPISTWPYTKTVKKLDSAKNAAKVFVNNMTSRDRVAIVAFSNDAYLYQSLTDDLTVATNKINALKKISYTNLRDGVYTGIRELTLNGTADVKAVILMTDGNWNYGGTPLGKGTGWPEDNTDFNLATYTFYTNDYRYIPGLDDGGTLSEYESANCAEYNTTQCDVVANKCKTCASGYTGPDDWGRCKKKIGFTWHYYYPDDLPASCTARQCSVWHCDSYTKYKCLDGYTHEQNMGIYASNNEISLYSISFGNDVGEAAQDGLDELATTADGFWSHAPDGAALKNIYEQIAGILREVAGVDTILNLAFDNVAVTYDGVTTSHPGVDVFRYDYNTSASTNVTSYNATYHPLPDLVTIPAGYMNVNPRYGTITKYPYNFDQSHDWESSELNFNAGTIRIGQTWETKFRFITYDTVLGNIDIFGPGSVITLHDQEGATTTLSLPHTYVSVVSDLTNIGTTGATLDLSNLVCTQSGSITDFIPVQWNIAYSGTHTVTEKLSYSTDGGISWTVFDTNYVTSSTVTDYADLDVRSLPAGEYLIRVDAIAPDSPSDRETLAFPVTVGTQGRAFIKLE